MSTSLKHANKAYLLVVTLMISSPAVADDYRHWTAQRLLQAWSVATTDCQSGASNDPETDKACSERDEINKALFCQRLLSCRRSEFQAGKRPGRKMETSWRGSGLHLVGYVLQWIAMSGKKCGDNEGQGPLPRRRSSALCLRNKRAHSSRHGGFEL
jgi:hypothetical protein